MFKRKVINKVKNNGFIFEEDNPKDYVSALGAVPTTPLASPKIIFPSGHGWHDETVRAKAEMQFNRNFDSYSCVIFTISKALVAYLKKVYGVEVSVAEMFNAHVGLVRPNYGTTVRNGLEGFRKNGWVEDSVYPFTKDTTLQQYFATPPKSIFLKAEGKLTEWKVNWEVIDTSGNVNHSLIKESLKVAPVVASGFAWASYYGEGVYYDYNYQANHAFLIDDYADAKDHDLLVYDSYPLDNNFDEDSEDDEFVKKLAKNYRVWSAHRVWLTPVNPEVNHSLISKLLNMFKKISRDTHGGLWFIKDNKKQKIENWLHLAGALVDEIGVEKNNLTDEELDKIEDTKFFGSFQIFV